MNALSLYSIVIVLAVLFATVQPGDGSPVMDAAMAIAGPDLVPTCNTTACLAGWRAAHDHAINDEAECHLVSADQAGVAGCRAFVQETLQDRLENQW